MDVINTIMTKAYITNCKFANFGNFRAALIKYGLNDFEVECKSIFEMKNNLKDNLSKYENKYEDIAFIRVLIEDIENIIFHNDENCRYNIDEMYLKNTMKKYIDLLEKFGIYALPPQFFVVDRFPAPFDNNDWSAFCPDADDEKKYGIQKGIYFLRKHIRPYYSEILLAHEIIHSLCGENAPELFAMGLEEGIAEIIGSLYLSSNVLNLDVVSNNFSYTRFNKNANLLWTLYLDHTRQAYSLYKKFGIEVLIYLINKGRKEIHDVERKMFSKNKLLYDFGTKTYLGDEFDNMLDYLLMQFTPNYVVTPLQTLLIREAKEGILVNDICEKLQISKEVGKNELEKIAFNTSLFMLDGDKIGYSNVETYEMGKYDSFIPVIRYFKEI